MTLSMALSIAPAPARADDVNLTPGPTIIKDPSSPTGYTGHFVYYNNTATSVRFVADILLKDWLNPAASTVYQPSQYRPGLMRGASCGLGQFQPVSGEQEEFGMLFQKGNPLVGCVDEALAALKSDGTIDQLEQQWLSNKVDVPVLQ